MRNASLKQDCRTEGQEILSPRAGPWGGSTLWLWLASLALLSQHVFFSQRAQWWSHLVGKEVTSSHLMAGQLRVTNVIVTQHWTGSRDALPSIPGTNPEALTSTGTQNQGRQEKHLPPEPLQALVVELHPVCVWFTHYSDLCSIRCPIHGKQPELPQRNFDIQSTESISPGAHRTATAHCVSICAKEVEQPWNDTLDLQLLEHSPWI